MPLVVTNSDSINSLRIIYDDINSTYVKTNIQYSLGDKLKIQGKIRLADFSPTAQAQAWHLPSFSYSSRFIYSLGKTIELTAGFDGVGNRFNRMVESNSFKTVKVPGYFDLFARADYRVLGKGRIWIQASNILSSQYQQWYGYRNYGLTVMGGLSIALF
jgi:outer membrane cobalamin receptor